MSDSSFIPEQQLVFSPALAATIGLEESILLQQLNELFKHRPTDLRNGFAWLSIERQWLLENLPFWNAVDLHQVSKSLADKGVILMGSPPLHESELFLFALNDSQQPSGSPAARLGATQQPASAGLIADSWTPSADLLQMLGLSHNISRQFALDQLEDFVFYWRECGEISHAWENKFRQHVLSRWRLQQQAQAPVFAPPPPETPVAKDWRPSEDAMDILLRAEIKREFIEDAIPEFILYWRDRGETIKTLNSKFINHIRRQWARFTSALTHDTEPRRIPGNWQPIEDVYDILRMAHIDADFARQLLPEFIVYWQDTNQLHSSWNTKFLQRVKYKWANRHQFNLDTGNARQQRSNPTGRSRDRSLADDLADRSWAD